MKIEIKNVKNTTILIGKDYIFVNGKSPKPKKSSHLSWHIQKIDLKYLAKPLLFAAAGIIAVSSYFPIKAFAINDGYSGSKAVYELQGVSLSQQSYDSIMRVMVFGTNIDPKEVSYPNFENTSDISIDDQTNTLIYSFKDSSHPLGINLNENTTGNLIESIDPHAAAIYLEQKQLDLAQQNKDFKKKLEEILEGSTSSSKVNLDNLISRSTSIKSNPLGIDKDYFEIAYKGTVFTYAFDPEDYHERKDMFWNLIQNIKDNQK